MQTIVRLSLISAVAIAAQMASAAVNYNVLQATVAYNNGDSETLTSNVNGNTISFTNGTPMLVGNGGVAGHDAALVTIIYTATSDGPLTGVNLDFSGVATNLGQVNFSELVENWNSSSGAGTVIGSASGAYNGSGLNGGSDSPFSDSQSIVFSTPVNSYLVKKTFTLLDLDSTPTNSSAQLDSVDQTAVPEPATMTALVIGGLGLLARRKKK
jgi:hypothetical protein